MLLGGKDRDYDYKPMMQKIAEAKVPALVMFPETTAKMKAVFPAGYEPEIWRPAVCKKPSLGLPNTPPKIQSFC